jgi:hypothetical protein
MANDLERLIRERAYELWERAGRVHGQADAHWHAAKLELKNSHAGKPAEIIAVPAKRSRRKPAAAVETVNTTAEAAPRRRRPGTPLPN